MRGDQGAGPVGGFHHHDAQRQPADNPIPGGKTKPFRQGAQGGLADDRAVGGDLRMELLVLAGIDDVQAAAHDRNGLAPCRQRSPVGGGVYPQGKAAGDDQIKAGQFRGQPLRHLQSIRGGRPCSDHGDARSAEELRISQDMENHRRVVYFLEQGRKERIVPAKQGGPCFCRQAKLFVRCGLGNAPLVAQRGKGVFAQKTAFRKRLAAGRENLPGGTEPFDKFLEGGWAEPWGKGEGEPLESGVHVSKIARKRRRMFAVLVRFENPGEGDFRVN